MAAEPHQIILTIKTDGTMTSQVSGVSGPSCADLTKWVKQLGVVENEQNTPDYYKSDDQGVTTGY
jgi:hypothetical protein